MQQGSCMLVWHLDLLCLVRLPQKLGPWEVKVLSLPARCASQSPARTAEKAFCRFGARGRRWNRTWAIEVISTWIYQNVGRPLCFMCFLPPNPQANDAMCRRGCCGSCWKQWHCCSTQAFGPGIRLLQMPYGVLVEICWTNQAHSYLLAELKLATKPSDWTLRTGAVDF